MFLSYIYNVDDELDSEDERTKHDGDEGMDMIELYLHIRNGFIIGSQADKDTVQQFGLENKQLYGSATKHEPTKTQTYKVTNLQKTQTVKNMNLLNNKPTKTQNLHVASGFLTTYTIPELDLIVASP